MVREKSIEEIHITNLSNKRMELHDKYEDSYDKEANDYQIEWDEEIDKLADQILDCLKKWKYALHFEFIIEELTKLGWAPCLLYDDNGHFAISGEGWQTISAEGKDDCHLSHYIEEKMWKDSIREALDYYLDYDE